MAVLSTWRQAERLIPRINGRTPNPQLACFSFTLWSVHLRQLRYVTSPLVLVALRDWCFLVLKVCWSVKPKPLGSIQVIMAPMHWATGVLRSREQTTFNTFMS